jgi:hypothetical protein
MKDIHLNTKIEVGDGSYYSEVAKIQTLDNLLAADRINMIQYFERIESINPDYIPDVKGLIAEIKQATEQQAMMGQYAPEQLEQMAQFMESLPPEQQAQLQALPDGQMEQQIMQMMGSV